jgi:hypothetical protein
VKNKNRSGEEGRVFKKILSRLRHFYTSRGKYKKTDKVSKSEIKRAENLRKKYFNEKTSKK